MNVFFLGGGLFVFRASPCPLACTCAYIYTDGLRALYLHCELPVEHPLVEGHREARVDELPVIHGHRDKSTYKSVRHNQFL